MSQLLSDFVKKGQTEVQPEKVSIKIDGRHYGGPARLSELFDQPVQPEFLLVAEEIEEQSQLLKLSQGVSKQNIFEAYAADLQLLNKYLGEFQAAMKHAVLCSSIVESPEIPFDRQWNLEDLLVAHMPPMGRDPLMKLPSTRAVKEPDILLGELQEEFRVGLVSAIRRMAFWLQMLTDEEFAGLAQWFSSDTCVYHYFRHGIQQQASGTQTKSEQVKDESQPFGQQITYTDIEERTFHRRQLLERHAHHIVNARIWDLSEFPDLIPERVQRFLDAVPGWLEPHLRIISGQITMEERVRKVVSDSVVTEQEVLSVWKSSPAVTFGASSLIGWSGDDLLYGAIGFARVQRTARVRLLKYSAKFGLVVSLCSVLVLLLIWEIAGDRLGFFIPASASTNSVAVSSPSYAANYAAYKEKLANLVVHSAARGSDLSLPGMIRLQYSVRYIGLLDAGWKVIRFSVRARPLNDDFIHTTTTEEEVQDNWLIDGPGIWYGDVSVKGGHDMVTVHIISATADRIEYAVTP